LGYDKHKNKWHTIEFSNNIRTPETQTVLWWLVLVGSLINVTHRAHRSQNTVSVSM